MSENLSSLSRRWSSQCASRGAKKLFFAELAARAQEKRWDRGSLEQLKEESHIGIAPMTGTRSFYDYTRAEQQAVRVRVCSGTCCEMRGQQNELQSKLAGTFGKSEIGHAMCLGRCYENRAFQVDGRNYSGPSGFEAWQRKEKSNHPKETFPVHPAVGPALLSGQALSPEDVVLIWGVALSRSESEVLSEIARSGLRGRGGAGFPLSKKLELCRAEKADEKFLVCNADEGDPGAFSDRYLLEIQPFRVLLGMALAARVIGAKTAIIYIRAEYPEAIEVVEQAVASLEAERLIQEIDFVVVRGAGSYVCGEETALLSSLEGQRPEVRVRPPYPVSSGLFLKPTVVSNVETLACLPEILTGGGEAFARVGTKQSSGTKLVCLDWAFNKPGVVEVPMGTALREILFGCGGGPREPLKAIQLGGPLGGIIPIQLLEQLTLDFESLQSHGFLLGHASVVSIPSSVPMIRYLEHLFRFVAAESCGKCYPCRIGSQRGAEMMEGAARRSIPLSRALLDDLLETMELGSLCALGGGLPLPIKNVLTYFSNELTPFLTGASSAERTLGA